MKRSMYLCAAAVSAAFSMLMSGCGNTSGTDNTQLPVNTPAVSDISGDVSVTEDTAEPAEEASAQTTTETTTAPVTETTAVTTELPFEDTPENAYERLRLSFITPEGDEIAPVDYGGVYSYFGTLYVAVTEDEPSEYYTSLLDGYTCVRYTTVSRSFNYLSNVCERAVELLDPEFGVEEFYIDVPGNKACAAILEGDPKTAQNFLKTVEDLDFELGDLEIVMADPPEQE